MAAIISRVKRYLLLITFYLALWADINQNCDYKNNDTSHSELEHRSRHLACVNLPRFALTTKVRTRASRFLPGRLQYTSKADSSFQIKRHMLSGDISPNPGPGKKSCKLKYPCKECGKQVKSNQDAILCSSCGMWSHAKCLHMTKAGFQYYLDQPHIEWNCVTCSLPAFSDSFFELFDTSGLYEDNNDNEYEISLNENCKQITINQELERIRKEYRKECIVASININSLQNKFVEVKEWLEGNLVDILTIQETKIDRTFPNSQFNISGYNLFRRDRKKGGGGIIVYVRDNIYRRNTQEKNWKAG